MTYELPIDPPTEAGHCMCDDGDNCQCELDDVQLECRCAHGCECDDEERGITEPEH